MTVVPASHIVLDDRGIAFIEETRTPVAMIVMESKGGLAPEKIQQSHPHLSMAQIHAALAFYYDHQSEIDEELARQSALVATLRAEAVAAGTQPTREELERRLRGQGNPN